MIIYDQNKIKIKTIEQLDNSEIVTYGGKRYIKLYAGYDTETTRINKRSYVYHFAISFNQYIFGFRKWDYFLEWVQITEKILHDRYRRAQTKPLLLIWVANLSFEFQFLKDRLKWDVFATKSRQPLSAQYGDHIQFREALKISGGNLAFLAKTYCKTQKMIGDLDYSKKRNSVTPLTEKELGYIENDVKILAEFSEYIFKNAPEWGNIPYTSTGILRHECKQEIKNDDNYKQFIHDNYFTETEYKAYMSFYIGVAIRTQTGLMLV